MVRFRSRAVAAIRVSITPISPLPCGGLSELSAQVYIPLKNGVGEEIGLDFP